MTWRPTPGMLKAESVVQTMLTDAATRHFFITDPTLRHRWVQTVADALDGFLRNADVAEFLSDDSSHMIARDESNGQLKRVEPVDDRHAEVLVDHEELIAGVIADHAPAKEAATGKRRGRGRPKLSAAEKKKRKAAKQANAVEAEAAT